MPTTYLPAIYSALRHDDVERALDWFGDDPVFDTPRLGRIRGRAALLQALESESEWLSDRNVIAHVGATVQEGDRVAHEALLWVTARGTVCELPILAVAAQHHGMIDELVLYYSTWPVTGGHRVRAPVLDPIEAPELPAPVAQYEQALRDGDVDAIDALFEADGYVREPAGTDFIHAGSDREEFYGPLRSRGGVPLRPCRVVDGGSACVVEYVCDEWAGLELPPQAGAAIWEYSPEGKIRAVRIYDDVTPPEAATA